MERAKRIELSSQPWQGRVLPLNHARENDSYYFYSIAILCRLYKYYFATWLLAWPPIIVAQWVLGSDFPLRLGGPRGFV